MSRREQRVLPAHWSNYLPQPTTFKPPSSMPRWSTPNLLMPQLGDGDRRDSRLERIPRVVIVDIEEEEEEEEGRQSEVDAKVTPRYFTSMTQSADNVV